MLIAKLSLKNSKIIINNNYFMALKKKIKISVLGMGYVGLPLAYEFGKYFKTIGYDISDQKISNLKNNLNFGGILNVKNKKNTKKLLTNSLVL